MANLLRVIEELEGKGYSPGDLPSTPRRENARTEEDVRLKTLETDLANARARLVGRQ